MPALMEPAAAYQTALDMGLSRREANAAGALMELGAIFREQREREERFAAAIGTTRDALKATPEADREALNERFRAWQRNGEKL